MGLGQVKAFSHSNQTTHHMLYLSVLEFVLYATSRSENDGTGSSQGFFPFQPNMLYLSILEFVLYHFVDATSRS